MSSSLHAAVRSGASAAIVGGLATQALIGLGRPASLLVPLALAWAVAVPARRVAGGRSRAGIAALVGIGPGIVILGVTHDATNAIIPVWTSALILQAAWTVATLGLGVPVANRLVGVRAHVDAWVRIVLISGATAYIAGALIRLLMPSRDPALRLSWMLGEEDNAQIVGIAREVIVHGPSGDRLASDFGTAFVNVPFALLRLLGGPLGAESDARLQATTLFVVSTIVVIALAGLSMALLSALPRHVHRDREIDHRRSSWASILFGGLASATASLIGFSILVVLPMRTGFLTFVWGLTLVLLAAALLGAVPKDAPPLAQALLLAHLGGTVLLLLSSWPFILPSLLPLGLLLLARLPWARAWSTARSHPGITILVTMAIVLLAGIAGAWFFRRGPVANILSFGTELLTVSGSAIYADDLLRRAALGAIGLVVLLALLSSARARHVPLVAIAGPVAGAGLLYGGLQVAAAVLTDGALSYAGIKLFYGILALSVVLGFIGLSWQLSSLGAAMTGLLLLALVALEQTSPTAALHREWWSQTYRPGAAHAEAVIDAIRGSSADIPIRCLPAPGTPVTDTTRMAAYFCARWVEDAFNEGSFDGGRADLLFASDETFGPIVDRIESENPSEYLFAYRMTMGPGWFGWNGGTS